MTDVSVQQAARRAIHVRAVRESESWRAIAELCTDPDLPSFFTHACTVAGEAEGSATGGGAAASAAASGSQTRGVATGVCTCVGADWKGIVACKHARECMMTSSVMTFNGVATHVHWVDWI